MLILRRFFASELRPSRICGCKANVLCKCLITFALCFSVCLGSSHSYYVTDSMRDQNNLPTVWAINGESPNSSDAGLSITSGAPVSYVSKVSPPSRAYEVAMTLTLNASGGTYVIYLQADNNALFSASSIGSFYAFVISDLIFSENSCTAALALYKTVNGTTTRVLSSVAPCGATVTYDASVSEDSSLHLAVNDIEYLTWKDSHPLSGVGGVGGSDMPPTNAISLVQIGLIGEPPVSDALTSVLLADNAALLDKPKAPSVIPVVCPAGTSIGYDETDFSDSADPEPTGSYDCINYLIANSGGPIPSAKPPSTCTFRAQYHTFYGVLDHGYITWTTNIMQIYYVYEGYDDNATGHLLVSFGPAPVTSATPASDPVTAYVSNSASCLYNYVLPQAQMRINEASITYHILGPNSNSVWRYTLGQIPTLPAFSPPVGAFGYSTKLPGVE